VNLMENAAAPVGLTLTDDSRNATQVTCSGSGQAIINNPDLPSATAFDTGNKAAAFCGRRCLDAYTVAGVDTSCTADLSGLGRHVVLMH
jgi:hypothetical protein